MNTVRNNHHAAPAARPGRGILLRALPWALAAAFCAHMVMERGLHLYKADPAATHMLEACLAAAVLIWVWRALRRMEDLPAGDLVPSIVDDDPVYSDSAFAGPGFPRWMDPINPATGLAMVNADVDGGGNPYGVDLDDGR